MLSPPENSTLKSVTVTALTADHGLSVTKDYRCYICIDDQNLRIKGYVEREV
jgi:hypothetical protein